MTKKNKSKTSIKSAQEETVAEEENKPSTTKKKKVRSEIDEIFAGKKRKKLDEEDATEKPKTMKKNKKKEKKEEEHNKVRDDGDGFGGLSSKPRKKMNGVAIYTEEELGINNQDAGGTPLCPFDCSCCF